MLWVRNWVWNQRLPDDKSSPFARKNASEMVLIPKGGGADGSEQSHFTASPPGNRPAVGEALHALPTGEASTRLSGASF